MSFNFDATAIGSFPHNDADRACQIILDNLTLPLWPQLPNLSSKENMYVQFSKVLPCIKFDGDRSYFDTSGDIAGELERFYENYLTQRFSYFRIEREYACGFYTFLEKAGKGGSFRFIKGQVTGPVSFSLTLTDQNLRPIIYNREIYEAIIKGLGMNACWQVLEFQKLGKDAVIFFDEPYLSWFGSSYLPIKGEEIVRSLDQVVQEVRKVGGICGVHCCGNTDWGLLLQTKIDILSFDAYQFFEKLLLYQDKLRDFFGRGGVLSLGIVPTDEEAFLHESTESLVGRVRMMVERLSDGGMSGKNFIITPTCGMGTLSTKISELILKVTGEVSACLRKT